MLQDFDFDFSGFEDVPPHGLCNIFGAARPREVNHQRVRACFIRCRGVAWGARFLAGWGRIVWIIWFFGGCWIKCAWLLWGRGGGSSTIRAAAACCKGKQQRECRKNSSNSFHYYTFPFLCLLCIHCRQHSGPPYINLAEVAFTAQDLSLRTEIVPRHENSPQADLLNLTWFRALHLNRP